VEVHASRQDGKRVHLEDMSVVEVVSEPTELFRRYRHHRRENPTRDLCFVDTHWPELVVEDAGARLSVLRVRSWI
jgi:hypothetical protein